MFRESVSNADVKGRLPKKRSLPGMGVFVSTYSGNEKPKCNSRNVGPL